MLERLPATAMTADVLCLKLPPRVSSSFAVLVSLADRLPEPKGIAAAWLERHCHAMHKPMLSAYVASRAVQVIVRPRSELSSLPALTLSAEGQGEEEARRAREASHVALVTAESLHPFPPLAATGSLAVAYGLAALLKGVVFALDLPRLLPLSRLDEPFMAEGVSVSSFLMCPRSVSRRGMWLTTMGMQRFGLPNLELVDVPASLDELATPLLMSAAQALLEGTFELGPRLCCEPNGSFTLPRDLVLSGRTLASAFGRPEAGRGRAPIRLSHVPRPRGMLARLRRALGAARPEGAVASIDALLRIGPPTGYEGEHAAWYFQALEQLAGHEGHEKLAHSPEVRI